jgi:hypothetical protein
LLRAGAANFSASGLKRQDNDLIVIESTKSAAVLPPPLGRPFHWLTSHKNVPAAGLGFDVSLVESL